MKYLQITTIAALALLPVATVEAAAPDQALVQEVCRFVVQPEQQEHQNDFGFSPTFPEGLAAWGQRVGWVDANNDGTLDYITRVSEGTAHVNREIISSGGTDQRILMVSDADAEVDRFEGWGNSDIQWFNYKGTVFRVSFNDSKGMFPANLWHTDARNNRRRLCEFKTEIKQQRSYGATAEEPAEFKEICKQVDAETLLVEKEASMSGQDMSWGNETYGRSSFKADVFHNGKPRKLWRATYASGRGAGCDIKFFLLDGDQWRLAERSMKGLSPESLQFYQMQGINFSKDGAIGGCRKNTEIMPYKGAPLFRTPDMDDVLKAHVWMMKSGKAQPVCMVFLKATTTFSVVGKASK